MTEEAEWCVNLTCSAVCSPGSRHSVTSVTARLPPWDGSHCLMWERRTSTGAEPSHLHVVACATTTILPDSSEHFLSPLLSAEEVQRSGCFLLCLL